MSLVHDAPTVFIPVLPGPLVGGGSRESPFQEETASRKRSIQPPDSRDRKNSECTYLKAKKGAPRRQYVPEASERGGRSRDRGQRRGTQGPDCGKSWNLFLRDRIYRGKWNHLIPVSKRALGPLRKRQIMGARATGGQ